MKFVKGFYGPYAENLRHVLKAVEGHLVSGYFDGGDVPTKPLEVIPGALDDAQGFIGAETKRRLDRVSKLLDGFEPPFGLALLATVHWVACEEGARAADEVVRQAYRWGPRQHQFSKRELGIATEVLASQGWLGNEIRAEPADVSA